MNKEKDEWNQIHGLVEQIKSCDENGLVMPSIAMSFICIDAMANLSRPSGKVKVTRKDFIAWCNKYLKTTTVTQFYKYSGEDVYAARCALLHTYGTTAELHDKPKIVKFLYHDLNDPTHRFYEEEGVVVVSTKLFVVDVCNAVESFIAECNEQSEFKKLVLSRIENVLTVFPYASGT